MLRRTAGLPTASSPTQTAAVSSSNTLTDQRQSSKARVEGLASSNSCASISHQRRFSPGSGAPDDDTPEQLPGLPEIPLQPSKQSVDVRFGQYCQDLGTTITKERETKMHRRRKELIKALTTGAW